MILRLKSMSGVQISQDHENVMKKKRNGKRSLLFIFCAPERVSEGQAEIQTGGILVHLCP